MDDINQVDCLNCAFLCGNEVNLSQEEAQILNKNKTEVIYHANETLIKQGTFANDIFFIKEGVVKLFLESKNGKNVILQLLSSGMFIGFASMEEGRLYNYSVSAVKPTVVCVIKKDVINDIKNRNHQFINYLNDWLVMDHNMLYHKIRTVTTKNMMGRVAESLLYLDNDFLKKEDLSEFFTKREMAELAGVSLDSFNKILNDFKKEDIIDMEGCANSFLIKDRRKLEKISIYG